MSNMKLNRREMINNLINFTVTNKTPYELTLPEFVLVRYFPVFFQFHPPVTTLNISTLSGVTISSSGTGFPLLNTRTISGLI